MRRMLWLALAFVLAVQVVMPTPAAAQVDGCEVDLTEAIAGLEAAQAKAEDQNPFTAILEVEAALTQLNQLVSDCDDLRMPLSESYVSEDELLHFDYPAGWDVSNSDEGVYAVTNGSSAADVAESSELADLLPGDQVIMLLAGPADDVDSGATDFRTLVETIQQEDFGDDFNLIGPISTRPVGRYPAYLFKLVGDEVEGLITLADLGGNNVLFSFGVTTSDEIDDLLPTYQSLLRTLHYGKSLLPPGAALDDLTYATAVSLSDFHDDIVPAMATLAPDGSALAWVEPNSPRAVCVFAFDTTDVTCTELPDTFSSRVGYMRWSPDSKYLAFSEDYLITFADPDIWLLDVANQAVVNLTDDHYTANLLRPNPGSTEPVWLDQIFTWGPAGDLYFIRSIMPEDRDEEPPTGLYRLPSTQAKPELIYDLTGRFVRFSIYHNLYETAFDGAMAVSPDGSQLAFVVSGPKQEDPDNGVWLLNLSGPGRLRQLVTIGDLAQAMPTFVQAAELPLFITGLGWTDAGDQLFMLAGPVGSREAYPVRVLYQLDPVSGDLAPLNDLSQIEDEADLRAIDRTTDDERGFELPRTAIMAPDRSGPLILQQEDETNRVTLRAVTPTGELLTLYEASEGELSRQLPTVTVSIAADGKALLRGYLFLPKE